MRASARDDDRSEGALRTRLSRSIIGAGALAAAAWAGWFEPRRLVVQRREISIGSWPERLNGLRIGVVADLHVGAPHVDPARLQRLVSRLNGLSPDLTCLLGDYVCVDMRLGRRIPPDTACAPLARLHAPLGVHAVLGDHDWALDYQAVIGSLRNAGITVLEDAAVSVGDAGLWSAGVSRAWEPECDGTRALAAVPPRAPTIALAHSPDVFPSLPQQVALTMAGHTHGGQIRMPALTRRTIPSKYGGRYLAGLYREGDKHLFVHTGVGTSRVPVRFLVPPSIALLTIRSGHR